MLAALLLEVITCTCVHDGDCDRWIGTKRAAGLKESETPPVANTNLLLLFQVETCNLLQNDDKKASQWWTSSKKFTPSALVNLDESPVNWVVRTVSFGHPLFQQFATNTFKSCVLCCYFRWAIMQRTIVKCVSMCIITSWHLMERQLCISKIRTNVKEQRTKFMFLFWPVSFNQYNGGLGFYLYCSLLWSEALWSTYYSLKCISSLLA